MSEFYADMAAEGVRMAEALARVEALADELWRDGEAATRRRSYAQGVALREAATRLRAALRGDR